MIFMKIDRRANIDVGEAVAICEAERFFILKVRSDPFQTAARHGVFAGVDQRHTPVFRLSTMEFETVFSQIKRDI